MNDHIRCYSSQLEELSEPDSPLTSPKDFQRNRNQSDMMSVDIETLRQIVKEAMSAVIVDTSQTPQLHCPNLVPAGISAIDKDTTGCRERSPPDVLVLPSGLKTAGSCVLPLVPDALEYTGNDVPEPPAVGLDVERLAAIWDDSWPTWKNISPLVIKERPVPLKHFRSVYIGSSQWKKSIRQQWSRWNVCGLSQYSIICV